MKKLVLGVYVSLFLAVSAIAAPPAVSLPKEMTAKTGRLLVIEPKGTAEFKNASWEIKYGVGEDGKLIKPTSVDLEAVCDGKKAYFASTIPGEYVITVTVWNMEGLAKAETTVVVTGAAPNPFPNPNPDPKPNPVVKNVYIAIVKDAMSVNPATAAIIGDTAFWNDLTKGGSDWDSYNLTSEAAIEKGYVKEAQKLQTPGTPYVAVMLVMDKDSGKLLKSVKLESKEGVKSAISEIKK